MSHKKGVTLIEVLVVVFVLSILAATLYTVFKSGIDAWSKSDIRLDIFQNGRVILDQLTRELPAAFVGNGAQFTGTDGGVGNPDTIEFVTIFGGLVYKIKYELAGNILQRKYIKNPPDYANTDYENIVGEPDGIEEAIVDFGYKVSDIQFSYFPLGSATAQASWSGATLPEAVKVELKLKENPSDDPAKAHSFQTIIYLPNSE